ncbi:unnamed protein product [Boreogadus saida]
MLQEIMSNALRLHALVIQRTDDRLRGYLLMHSPVLMTLILLTYVFLSVYAGPRFMANRKPLDLKAPMVVYNFSMVVMNGYIVHQFLVWGWGTTYSWRCDLCDFSSSTQALGMVRASWIFYISKYIELLDTLFFVLRKKQSQITFLHVFHHSFMPWTWWWGITLTPVAGMGNFHSMINAGVHVIMYFYYGLSSAGPRFQKYLWWKKYLTAVQLIQFIMVSVHISQYYFMKDCDYQVPMWIVLIWMYGTLFFFLFAHFWVQAYIKGKRLPVAHPQGNGVAPAKVKELENGKAPYLSNGKVLVNKVKEN